MPVPAPSPFPSRREILLPLASAALAPWLGWSARARAESGPVAATAGPPGSVDADAGSGRVEIVLLHDNDQHFHYNHAEALRRTVNHVRGTRTNVYLLNAGDIFVRHPLRWAEMGSLQYYERMAARLIDEMNETGYDAMVLGNHEIHYHGEATLRQLRRARFPILGANTVSETPMFFNPPADHRFTTREGLGIAVLGLSVGGASGVTVRDREEVLREHLHLREESDLFVLLTHIGHRADLQLADGFPEVDLIIGGHSHTLLAEAEKANGVRVAQAGGHPHLFGGAINTERPAHLGVVQVVFENRELVLKHGRVFDIDPESEGEVRARIDDWLDRSLADRATSVARPRAESVLVV